MEEKARQPLQLNFIDTAFRRSRYLDIKAFEETFTNGLLHYVHQYNLNVVFL